MLISVETSTDTMEGIGQSTRNLKRLLHAKHPSGQKKIIQGVKGFITFCKNVCKVQKFLLS